MTYLNMKRVLGLSDNETITAENLTEEAANYINKVIDIKKLDSQFWNDFTLGVALWCMTTGNII